VGVTGRIYRHQLLLTAHRRLDRDYERDPAVSEAMIRWAAINTITGRLGHPPATTHLPGPQLIFSNTCWGHLRGAG
jgi:hypothetical protein